MTRNGSDRPHIFGWCNDGKHASCRGSHVTVVTQEMRHCECPCHGREAEGGSS